MVVFTVGLDVWWTDGSSWVDNDELFDYYNHHCFGKKLAGKDVGFV